MQDDKIKDLFSSFTPELSSDSRFMSTLSRNMEAVECVRQRSQAALRRNRIAVIVAAIAGFVTGVLSTLLMPRLMRMISAIEFDIPYLDIGRVRPDATLWGWCIAAILTVTISFNAYRITLSGLPSKQL